MADLAPGPQLPFCRNLHSRKYLQEGETFRDGMNRIANHLKDDDRHFHESREIMLDMRFMAAGRVQSAAGASKRTTAFNCFVAGTIHDSFTHGSEEEGWKSSIMGRAFEAAQTMRMGGGIGFDFSTLRPHGEWISGVASRTCGPIGFMKVYSQVGLATSSTDHRRGAEMIVLRVDHPDILAFISAKHTPGVLEGANLSIGVTHEFMECLATGRPFQLRWGGRTYGEVDPLSLWETIMRSTWDHAEPGVIFIDTVNDWNNLYYCETIAATNPCGEQPLPPYGACLLGSHNLVKYVKTDERGNRYIDYDQLRADIPAIVRMMDNVVDRTIYPLEQQELEARRKRRMGLGICGLANAVEACGYDYGSQGFLNQQHAIKCTIRDEAYRASIELAREKGPFPLFDAERYLAGKFVRTLPDDIRWGIGKYGIRNSHLTSDAPTGTISLCADNISSGIEPVFSYAHDRTEMQFESPVVHHMEDYGVRVFGSYGRRSADVTAREHVAVLATSQEMTDGACSKTCNVSPEMPWEDFKGLYLEAYELGCKGITTYTPENEEGTGGKRKGILVSTDAPVEGVSCKIDRETGERSCE